MLTVSPFLLALSLTASEGTISREAIQKTVRRHLAEVQLCFEKQLEEDPELEGKVVMLWTIRPNGRVGRVEVKESTLRSPPVHYCLQKRIATWKFEKPRGGSVDVEYPFGFRPIRKKKN